MQIYNSPNKRSFRCPGSVVRELDSVTGPKSVLENRPLWSPVVSRLLDTQIRIPSFGNGRGLILNSNVASDQQFGDKTIKKMTATAAEF